jgi:histone deacetylase 11
MFSFARRTSCKRLMTSAACSPLLAILHLSSCVAPQSFGQVQAPRPGRPIDDRVAIVYSRHYQISLGGAERTHSFDIRKYAKIYAQMAADGLLRPDDVFVPAPVTPQQILLVHTPGFLEGLHSSATVARYLEAPAAAVLPGALLDAGVLSAFRCATGGTIEAARLACRYGIGVNIGGGYHHAKPEAGGGFCIYNDMVIAIRILQQEKLAERVLVVDLDAHQGNGTAVCAAGDPRIFTFDMHEEDIYPMPKEHCSRDIGLPAGTGNAAYLRTLRESLPDVFEQSQPDAVLLQAGADVLEGDPLTHMCLSEEGIVQRDAVVIDECVRRKVPVVMVLGGGYSQRAWHVQYASIARTIRAYCPSAPLARPRGLTLAERLYVR